MADTPTPMNLRSRAIFLTVSIVALTILSFHGFLDRFAYGQVTDTTAESIGIYASSRAINAAISVLQSSQVSVGLGVQTNIQIGEIFDPVNDAIERLSTALVWAIGSLFLQRIVLEVTSSTMFQWAFLVTAVIVILSYFLLGFKRSTILFSRLIGVPEEVIYRWQYLAIKVFVLAVVVRFIVPAFLAASFLVSQMLLQIHLDNNSEQLVTLSNEISLHTELELPAAEQLARQKQETGSQLATTREERTSLQEKYDAIVESIEALNEKAGLRRFVPEMLGGKLPGEELESLRSQHDDLDRRIAELDDQIGVREEEVDCIDRQISGESCASLLEKIANIGKAGLESIPAAVEAASNAMVAIATVLMAVFAKNIQFPLVFLAIAVKCGSAIGRRALQLGAALKQDVGQLEAEARRIGQDREQA